MPRSPFRPTLKLPSRPATSSEADGPGVRARKPVRGGFKPAKQSLAKRPGNRAPAREVSAVPAETTAGNDEAPQQPEFRVAEKARNYPKRGIARSTGARAFPPPRPYGEPMSPRQEPERSHAAPLPHSPLPAPPPRYDAPPTPQTAEAGALRRPLKEPPRLSKRISEMSQCSRREADEWIENGWVSVDGVVITTLGTRVLPGARIEIKDAASTHQTESVTILFNKPLEGDGENAVLSIRPENRWREDDSRYHFKATHLRGLALAGQLDADATGMLVFTQEGSVARRIGGDDTRLEKEYMVRVEGELADEGMQLLNQGLALDEVKLKRAQVSWQSEQQLRFVLHESRKRQIQRMCELVGLRVNAVKRIRIGSVSLGKLPVGQWRYLNENERF
ncbi:MAG: pseudouridine synthase [Propionivibrio sp.]|nr:pseudouridine synthase [Propionivibrio sp.]